MVQRNLTHEFLVGYVNLSNDEVAGIQSNPIQSTFVKRHQSSCLFRGASQKHRGKPLLLTISALGSFTCITQHTGPTALRPIRRMKQLWLSVLLKDTSAATGNRTHILVFLTTPELESLALKFPNCRYRLTDYSQTLKEATYHLKTFLSYLL